MATNLEHFNDLIIEKLNNKDLVGLLKLVPENENVDECPIGESETLFDNFSNWICGIFNEEETEEDDDTDVCENPLLTATEIEYLVNFVSPFAHKNVVISKESYVNNCGKEREYLQVIYEEFGEEDGFDLPTFKAGRLYKNLEIGHLYSLEELGLMDRIEMLNYARRHSK